MFALVMLMRSILNAIEKAASAQSRTCCFCVKSFCAEREWRFGLSLALVLLGHLITQYLIYTKFRTNIDPSALEGIVHIQQTAWLAVLDRISVVALFLVRFMFVAVAFVLHFLAFIRCR